MIPRQFLAAHVRALRAPRTRRQRGVALLEVMVSILLFSIGLLGLLGLQARAISMSVDAEDRNRAALFANEIASSMWLSNSSVVDVDAGSPSWKDRVKDATASGLSKGLVTVTAVTPRSADIQITWKAPQRDDSEQDSRLVTRVTLPPP